MADPTSWDAYYAVVRRIPRGKVATYGQIALLAGRPRAARHVGYALAALRGAPERIPWQRVLGKRSSAWAAIAILDAIGAAAQRDLLEREGVAVDDQGRVSLERFGWRPRGVSGPARRRRAPAARAPASARGRRRGPG